MTDAAVDREQRAEQLKERVYVTFTALAVVLTLRADVAHETVGEATSTFVVAVVSTLLAVFVADVVAHVTTRSALPSRAELTRMAGVVLPSLGVLVAPLVFLGAASLDWWTLAVALLASSIALIAALVAIGWLAARRLRLAFAQRLVVLLAEFVLGVAVVALELLAH